jgi:hypothetical protein
LSLQGSGLIAGGFGGSGVSTDFRRGDHRHPA